MSQCSRRGLSRLERNAGLKRSKQKVRQMWSKLDRQRAIDSLSSRPSWGARLRHDMGFQHGNPDQFRQEGVMIASEQVESVFTRARLCIVRRNPARPGPTP
jgi:hypothetical protein